MKFTVKKSVTVSVASLAALSIFSACGIHKSATSSLHSAKQSQEISGLTAAALFALLEKTGIEADTIDGRMIVGATNLSAETVHCTVAMTANQDKRCELEKSGQGYEVTENSVTEKAVEALKILGAQVDQQLIGALNYEIKNLTCTSPVVPSPVISCTYELSSGRSDQALELSAFDAATFFDALTAFGLKPATVDGHVIYGATTLKADAIHCSSGFDANFTKSCEASADGNDQLELNDAALAEKLVNVMERIGAQVDPQLIGATNYEVRDVSCTKGVYPGAHASCSLKLAK